MHSYALQLDAEMQSFTQITAEGIRGRFRQVLNNTNFVDAKSALTLGVLTFNQFGPTDLKVQMCTAAILTRWHLSIPQATP